MYLAKLYNSLAGVAKRDIDNDLYWFLKKKTVVPDNGAQQRKNETARQCSCHDLW